MKNILYYCLLLLIKLSIIMVANSKMPLICHQWVKYIKIYYKVIKDILLLYSLEGSYLKGLIKYSKTHKTTKYYNADKYSTRWECRINYEKR